MKRRELLEVEYTGLELRQRRREELASIIEQQAQPWLRETQADITLYRGITADIATYKIFPIRTDRPPADTGIFRHNVFNVLIEVAGGYANRSNSAFAIRHIDTASAYGPVYVFIPLGEFRYTYSPVWSDWTARATADQIIPLLNKQAVSAVFQFFRKQLPNEPLRWVMKNVRHHMNQALTGANASLPTLPWVPLINKILQDPTSYDRDKVKNVITADRDLSLLPDHREIMIAAQHGLYINPRVYREIVLPELKESL